MQTESFKALALLGGLATLALGSTFMLRASGPKLRPELGPCAPRLLELERAVCEPLPLEQGRELASSGGL